MRKPEKDADQFIALIDKYENFDTLTITMLNEFVEKILVHERDRKGSQDTTQEIEIYFNFVGRFIPPALRGGSFNPRGIGGNPEKRGTQGQASSELFEAESQRQAERI